MFFKAFRYFDQRNVNHCILDLILSDIDISLYALLMHFGIAISGSTYVTFVDVSLLLT